MYSFNILLLFQNSYTHLSEVVLSVLLGSNTLNLDERGVGTGVALSTLVAENTSLRVESMNARK